MTGPPAPGRSDSEAETARALPEGAWFPAAGSDPVTWALTVFLLLVLGLLVLLGGAQAVAAWRVGAWTDVGRGAGFVALGLVLGYLTVARMPVAYRVVDDPRHGVVLEIRRRAASPVRLRLGDYLDAVPRRVVFPWIPLASGTRVLGLRGARMEQMLLGFWSFGRNGRRAVVLAGPGRPLTLVSPLDQEGFLAEVRLRIDGRGGSMEAAPRPVVDSNPMTAAGMRRAEGADVDAGVVEVRAFFDLADRVGGLTLIEMESGATPPTVESVAELIGLPRGSVAFAMVNGCMAGLDIAVAAGDRVALFPDYVPYHKVYGTCVI